MLPLRRRQRYTTNGISDLVRTAMAGSCDESFLRAKSLHGYRRTTHAVIRSVRTEGEHRHGAFLTSEVLNYLEMMLVTLIVSFLFTLRRLALLGASFFCEGW